MFFFTLHIIKKHKIDEKYGTSKKEKQQFQVSDWKSGEEKKHFENRRGGIECATFFDL